MRPELRKTSYLRKLKAEILDEAGGVDLPEDFEDIKKDIYGDDGAKDGLIADVSAIKAIMSAPAGDGGVLANIIDWRMNGVRKDDLAGDVFTVDDSTPEVDGSPNTYQVPDGTSLVAVDWSDIASEITLLQPDDAPSVILVLHEGDYMEKVLHWGGATLSVCPMNLLVRAGANWEQVPLANAFEYRMKNDVFTYDGTEDTEPKTVSVPAGTGRVYCENLAEDVTLEINGVFYPQLIGIGNKDNSTGNVVFNGVTVEPDEFAVIMNVGSMWVEIPFGA